jgi:GLPGLI family protein
MEIRFMNRLLALTLILLPAVANAQEGTILFDRSVRYEFELSERQAEQIGSEIPSSDISSMLLFFNASSSLMVPAPAAEEEESAAPTTRAMGMVTRLKMSSTSRSDQEVLIGAFANLEDGAVAETRTFMGRTFQISGTRPAYQWRMTGEQSELLGYVVHKATAVQDSSVIEAWFTPEIPVSTGPGVFGGLPGMILSISVDDGKTVYSASEVSLRSIEEGLIQAPVGGEEVSREEYEEIVAEKLEELEMQNRSRGRRRGGGDLGGGLF